MRELTLATVYHPATIDGGVWTLVDHPTVRPLQDGAPQMGWDGDPRLAVYLHNESKTFVLWRLEHDGEYRPVCQLPPGQSITPGNINRLIANLLRIDSRRGFDPAEAVYDAMAEQEADREREYRAWLSDYADKFHFALSRSHMPGIHVTRIRNAIR